MNIKLNATFILLSIATLASAVLSGFMLYQYKQKKNIEIKITEETSQRSLNDIVEFFGTRLATISDTIAHLINDPQLQSRSAPDIEKILRGVLTGNAGIHSIGIAYEPEANAADRLDLYYVQKHPGDISRVSVSSFYDYTKSSWYTDALQNKQKWVSPYEESSVDTVITRYAQALTKIDPITNKKIIYGVLTVDIAVEQINDALASLNIDKNSYSFITGKKGILIAYPIEHYIQEEKSIYDLAQMPGQKDLITLGNQIAKTDTGTLILHDTKIKKEYRATYKHIPKTEWTAIVVTPKKHDFLSSTSIRRSVTKSFLSIFLFIFLLSTLVFRVDKGTQHKLWLCCITLSLLLAISTILMWALDVTSTERKEFHEHVMNNSISVNRFFYLQKRLNPVIYKTNPHFIPTGVFLYAIDLAATSPDVSFSGHIWQKYNVKTDKDISQGVTILNAKQQSFEKIYENKNFDIHTIGWRFRATIKSNFNFYKYPFDQQNIVLMLAHQDYKANVILTPDFEAFSSKNIASPEIDPSANTGQWTTVNTYSFYQLTNYVTDFGIEDYSKQKNFPHLSFNILVRRNFSDPLITNFLPIAIIITISFAIIILTGLSNMGTDIASRVLPMCSSIFFAAAVGHQTYERTLESSGITYFEYFYFMLYVIILLTTTNGMLYGYNRGGKLLHYRNNFIPRLLYWPIVLLTILINTLAFFY